MNVSNALADFCLLIFVGFAWLILSPRKNPMRTNTSEKRVNVLIGDIRDERYIIMYVDQQYEEAAKTLGRWAANPELSMCWMDAAMMAQRIQARRKEHERK